MFKAKPKSKKLSSANIAEINEAKYHYQLKKMEIVNRAFYIYQCIAKEFGIKIASNWKIDDDSINDVFFEDVEKWDYWDWDIFDNPIDDYAENANAKPLIVIIGKDEYNFGRGTFPARWLFEDFEKELAEGVRKHEDMRRKEREQEEKELQMSKELRKNRAKIIQSVKKKLTMEEIEVVFGSSWQP